MPEIPLSLPGEPAAGPTLSFTGGALPAEFLAGLQPGDGLAARVLMQVAASRYLLLLAGREVLVDSKLALAVGERLSLVVKQAGEQLLLDLVPLRPSAGLRSSDAAPVTVPPGAAAPPGAASEIPAPSPTPQGAPAGQETPAAAAPRALRAELQNALSRGAPLGELLNAASRALVGAGGSAEPAIPAEPVSPAAPLTASAGGAPASAAPAAASPAPTAAPTLQQISALLREIALVLPEAAAAPAGTTPAVAAGGRLGELAAALPARLAEALAAVEARAAQVLAALPGAAALRALIEALDLLPAPTPAAPAGAPALAPELRGELAPLLRQALEALGAAAEAGGRAPALPPELRQALAALDDRQRTALRTLAAEGERALAAASPGLAALGAAHRALLAAQERTELARLWNLSASSPGQSFSYLELPVAAGGEAATARLKVMVRKDPDGGRGKRGRRAGRTARAVLDLALSALGEVWSELTLTDKSLAVRLELPDEARRDFVAARLGELSERLAGRGLEPELAAAARTRRRGAREPEAGSGESGGLDLWA